MKRFPIGFTLIEVVLALALGAMLMAALVGVLRSTNRTLQTAKANANVGGRARAALPIIARDLLLAQTISLDNDWLQLSGSFPDFGKQGETARQVQYGVTIGFREGDRVLMRVCDGRGQSIASGINALRIERVDSSGSPQPISNQQTALRGIFRVWLWEVGTEKPVVERDIVVH